MLLNAVKCVVLLSKMVAEETSIAIVARFFFFGSEGEVELKNILNK